MTPAQIALIIGVAIAAVAWLAFAEHPTTQTFVTAARRTLPLL
jgi:hypothetical protein